MSRGRKILLILIAILVILGLLGIAAYYLGYLDKFFPQKNTPGETTSEEPETTQFSGEFVSAEVPSDWTIVEYRNGAGTTMLTSGVTYTGLTGLEVKNPAGTVIFSLKAVYGIGGTGACSNYFRFTDNSTAYYNAVVATNTEVGEPAPTVVDLTASTYSSINLFDAQVRRVGVKLYWDTVPGNATFEAGCGMQENLFNFDAPQFTIVGQGTSGTYQWIVLSTATADELTDLDTILNSLTITP